MKRVHTDISDKVWSIIESRLPGQNGQWGGVAKNNRAFINGVFWILSTGSPWRELPSKYGKWGTVHQRFCRWRDSGVWESLLEVLVDESECEWLFQKINYYKVNPYKNDEEEEDKYTNHKTLTITFTFPWIRMICRSEHLAAQVPRLVAKSIGEILWD